MKVIVYAHYVEPELRVVNTYFSGVASVVGCGGM